MPQLQLTPRDHICPAGYQWYTCQKSGFAGCCADNRVCDRSDGCPAGKEVAEMSTSTPTGSVANTSAAPAEGLSTSVGGGTRTEPENGLARTTPPLTPSGDIISTSSLFVDSIVSQETIPSGSTSTTLSTGVLSSSSTHTNGDRPSTVSSVPIPSLASSHKSNATLAGGVIGSVVGAIVITCLFLYITTSRRKKKRKAECRSTNAEKWPCSGAGGGAYSQELLDSPTVAKENGELQTAQSPGVPPQAYARQPVDHIDDDQGPDLDSLQTRPEVELPGPIPLPHPPSNILELPNTEVPIPDPLVIRNSVERPAPHGVGLDPVSAARLLYPPTGPDWAKLDSTNAGIMASRFTTAKEASDRLKPGIS